MVLYHAVSTFQLLEFILHRISKEKNRDASILITTDIVTRYPEYEKMLKPYFENIFIYENYQTETLLDDEDAFNKYFDDIFGDSIDVFNMENIYAACCHAGFGVYLAKNNIPYVFFEDACGAMSHIEGIQAHVRKGNTFRAELLERYRLFDGTGSNVTQRVYNFNANKNVTTNTNDIDFDVAIELGKLSEQQRENLIKLFVDIKKIAVNSSCVLFLTEHLYNLKFMTWEEQCMMYQQIVDYFLSGKQLVFKTHPDDLVYYKRLFPKSKVIRKKFPAELLPYILDDIPETIATVSSTSIYGLLSVAKQVLEFNQEFSYFKAQYYDLHKYYVALKYINELYDNSTKVVLAGTNNKIIHNFMNFCEDIQPFEYEMQERVYEHAQYGKTIYLVDRTEKITQKYCQWLEQLDSNAVVIFLNSDEQYCFYDIRHLQVWNYITPIQIEKVKKREYDVYSNTENEMIYVYSKKGEIGMEKQDKVLENSGIEILTETFCGDKLRIMVLEGMLKATEKRLLYYMEKCEEGVK